LVFDIGIPSVINNYGSAQTTNTLSDQPTTAQNAIITASTTGAGSAATSGSPSAVTTTDPAGNTITTTPQATGTTTSSQATSTKSHQGLIIGVAAGVVVLLILAIITGILVCCVLKKKRTKETPVNLIDMNPHNQPQQFNTASNAHLVQQQGAGHGGFAPDKPAWDPVPVYTPPPWQQQPVNGYGQTLVELQSPAVQQKPPGAPVYEMH
jgi:hypothetical protein